MNTTPPKSNTMAGGFFIAAGMLGGAIAGVIFNQPSIGMVAGLAFGIVVAIVIWAMDRKRD
jgi:multisubunit Na+/H+ antiporter MnhB subunit